MLLNKAGGVLVPRGFRVVGAPVSDHRAIVADFEVP
jgi:hypothetical protein